MKKNRWIKTGADMVILLCSVILCVQIYFESHRLEQSLLIFYLLVFVGVLALADLIYQVYCQKRKENIQEKQEPSKTGVQETGRLILLDEEDQPVKSWDIAGRISILIGKSGGEDDVDVDLDDIGDTVSGDTGFLSILSNVKIPGVVIGSICDGIVNSLMTLRIGYVTRNYLIDGMNSLNGIKAKRKAKRAAVKEALKSLPKVVVVGTSFVGKGAMNIILNIIGGKKVKETNEN